jgi:hypothetical protein
MALVGYQLERQKIDEKIRDLQARLGGRRMSSPASVTVSAAAASARKGVKRVLSPEARKRIAAAQKKRWAEHRKRVAAGE